MATAGKCLAATVGVGLVPPPPPPGLGLGAGIGRRAVGVGGTVVSAGTPVIAPAVGGPGLSVSPAPSACCSEPCDALRVVIPYALSTLPQVIPQYARNFGSFSGSLTGYIRDQWETRDGSFIRGGYTMVDADGSLVVVEYSSDPINGFRVIVKRSGFPDYFLDSIVLGGPLPGGYLPPFYSDFGFDYSDDYYGYDYDYYYGGLDYDLDFVPTYYSDLEYETYAPTFVDTYDIDADLIDLDLYRRRRRSAPAAALRSSPRVARSSSSPSSSSRS